MLVQTPELPSRRPRPTPECLQQRLPASNSPEPQSSRRRHLQAHGPVDDLIQFHIPASDGVLLPARLGEDTVVLPKERPRLLATTRCEDLTAATLSSRRAHLVQLHLASAPP